MRNMKFLLTIAMVVLIPTTSAIAQKTPSKIRLEAGSKDGALLLRTEFPGTRTQNFEDTILISSQTR